MFVCVCFYIYIYLYRRLYLRVHGVTTSPFLLPASCFLCAVASFVVAPHLSPCCCLFCRWGWCCCTREWMTLAPVFAPLWCLYSPPLLDAVVVCLLLRHNNHTVVACCCRWGCCCCTRAYINDLGTCVCPFVVSVQPTLLPLAACCCSLVVAADVANVDAYCCRWGCCCCTKA